MELAQAGEDRSVYHFVTNLDPDATDQCRVNVHVDLELAPVKGIQPRLQAAGLCLRQRTGDADRCNPALLALGCKLRETTDELGHLEATGLRHCLSDKDLRFLACTGYELFGEDNL